MEGGIANANLRLTLMNSAATVMNYQRIQDLEHQVAESKERLDVVEDELGLQGELLRRTMRIMAGMKAQIEKLQSNQERLVALLSVLQVHFSVCFPIIAKRRGIPSILREALLLLGSGVLLKLTQVDTLISLISGLLFSVAGKRSARLASNVSRLAAVVGLYLTIKPYFING